MFYVKTATMARKKSMTRAEMISMLKSRGQKGALSKMTKPQLRALLGKTAPPGAHSHDEKPRSEIALVASVCKLVALSERIELDQALARQLKRAFS